MALPRIFAALTSAQMSYLDDDFNAVGALTTLQTTASGTNTVTLTPAANAPTVGAYGLPNPVRFGFVAAATSSGAVTLRVNALAFLKLFMPTGVQATTADITSGFYYEVVYISSLDTGSGGFQVVSSVPGTGSTPVAIGSAKGLLVTNNAGTPATKIDITANKAVMATSAGLPVFASAVAVTIDLTTTGANGMDTGARPSSGWVYLYLISNGSVTAGIATATSPTAGSFSPVPSGYIYSTFVGTAWCDGSQNLFRFRQAGNVTQWIIGTNPTLPTNIANGIGGTYSTTSPTLAAISVSNVVPLTAGSIRVLLQATYHNGTASNVLVAPNTSWGGTNNGPIGSANQGWPGWLNIVATNATAFAVDLLLESTNIAWASNAAGAGVSALGYRDYYVNA